MDRADFDNNILHYYATSMVAFDGATAQKAAFERQVRQHYCEKLKTLWQANIGMTFKLTVPPRTLSDRMETYSLALQPKECQPGLVS